MNTGDEMVKMWVVGSGYYSDYVIVGVFDTEALADECGTLYDDSSIDSFELNEMAEHPPGCVRWLVRMHDSGDCTIYQSSPGTDAVEPIRPTNREYVWWCLWAKDKAHAAKIANEKRAQLIACNQWP